MENRHFFTVTVVKKRQKLRSERDFGNHDYTALTRFQHLINKAHIHFCLPGARNSEKQRGFGLVALKSTAEVFECCRLLTCQHYILFICPVQKFWAAENLVIKKFQYAFALKRCHNGCCNTGEIANLLYRSRTRIREELYNLLLLSGKFRRFSEGIIEFRELYHFTVASPIRRTESIFLIRNPLSAIFSAIGKSCLNPSSLRSLSPRTYTLLSERNENTLFRPVTEKSAYRR